MLRPASSPPRLRQLAEFRRDEGGEPRAGSLLVPSRGTLGLTER
jgi:hypothetical protein